MVEGSSQAGLSLTEKLAGCTGKCLLEKAKHEKVTKNQSRFQSCPWLKVKTSLRMSLIGLVEEFIIVCMTLKPVKPVCTMSVISHRSLSGRQPKMRLCKAGGRSPHLTVLLLRPFSPCLRDILFPPTIAVPAAIQWFLLFKKQYAI